MDAGVFIGCGIFEGFATILEQICHAIVLTATGSVIRDNIWLYAVYGGLAAAFGLHLAVDFLTVICASVIPAGALELRLLVIVAEIRVAAYKPVYVQTAEEK